MSAIPVTGVAPAAWPRALAVVAVLLGLIAWAYRDTALAMVKIWSNSDTFAHGWLVLPMTLWMIWRNRQRVAILRPQSSPVMLAAMAVAAALWFAADLVAVNAAAQFAFVALLVLAVPTALGIQVAHAMLFPLLFLFFAVPFGEFMLQPMMNWTADFVVLALRFTGIPVYREGLHFVIPSGSWSVIDECSGVRYLIASFMVGSLFAYLNYRSNKRRAIFMLVSLLVPIVANWLRAYIIVMMGHLSGNRLAVGVDHLLYGWLFFGVVIFIMFTIGMRWSEPDEPAAVPVSESASMGPSSEAGPTSWLVPAAAAAIAILPHLGTWQLRSLDQASAAPTVTLPDQLTGWRSVEDTLAPGWKPHYPGAAVQVRKLWSGPKGRVGVHVAYYRAQTADSKLVSSVNGVVSINDRVWNPVGNAVRQLERPGGAVTLRATEILGPQHGASPHRPHLVIWQAYWIDGRWIAGDVGAKLASAVARLRGRGDDGAVVVFFAEEATMQAADSAVRAFAESNLDLLDQSLQRTRQAR